MLKLINVGSYDGSSLLYTNIITSKIVNAINNNSEVFTATVDGNIPSSFNLSSKNLNIIHIGFYESSTSENYINKSGYTVAIDDSKEFLMIISKDVLNTQVIPEINSNTSFINDTIAFASKSIMIVTGKDMNNNAFNYYFQYNSRLTNGVSAVLDIGLHGTNEYSTDGDFIMRQGSVRNKIVPELFFSMTRLGACGDIIEKDGHQYTCIAGPVFYQIS